MIPMPPQINQQEDPMEILRRAQEALRAEEEKKAQFMQAAQEQAQQQQQQQLLQQMRMAQMERASQPITAPETGENNALKQLQERLSQKYHEDNPLMKRARMSPEEIAREMRTANEPKNKWVRGALMPFAMLGGYNPAQYNDKAADQFLRTQEQYRKDLSTDYTALKDAAKITSTDTNAGAARDLKAQQLNVQQALGTAKAINETFKFDLAKDLGEGQLKRWTAMSDNEKEKLRLMAETIPENEIAGKMFRLVSEGKTEDAQILYAAATSMAKLRAAQKASPGGQSTSVNQGVSNVTTIGPDGNAQVQQVPRTSTTTRNTPPSPASQWLQGQPGLFDSYKLSPTQPPTVNPSPALGISKVQESTPTIAQANRPALPRIPGRVAGGYRAVEAVPVRNAGVNTIDLGFPKTYGDADKTKSHNEALATVNDLFNSVMDAAASGVVDRVHGVSNNVVGTAERARGIVGDLTGNFAKSAAYETAQKEWNALSDRYKEDPKAMRYFQAFNNLNTKALANYIKDISGAQSAAEEANRLSQLFPKASDSSSQVVAKMVELQLNVALLEKMKDIGMTRDEINQTGKERLRLLNETKDRILSNLQKARPLAMSGAEYKSLLPGPAEFDMNRLLKEAGERSGVVYKNVQFREEGNGPTARDQLMIKGGRPNLAPSRKNQVDSLVDSLLQESEQRRRGKK